MKTYTDNFWQITIPDDWQAELDDDCTSIFHDDSFGILQISAEEFEDEVDYETLAELAEEHIDAGAELEDIQLGPFEGFTLDYSIDKEFWREWYLCYDRLFIYVTYNCLLEDESSEDDIVDTILSSLKINTH
ncbi:MAG: hypothetical protein OEY52_02710 [Gammaproteobacteria bacterium]|nr:hypothetical protein [Gammaproteobacteria bacterium]